MKLLDHFHPPLSQRRHWHAFHNAWATYLAAGLNRILPEGWFAEPNVQFGIEVDMSAWSSVEARETPFAAEWQPPIPTQTVTLPLLTDRAEILVYQTEGGPVLAGAIDLVSPANKDRGQTRGAFVSKCRTYLQENIGVVVVDIDSSSPANLHAELLESLGQPDVKSADPIYAVAYRPVGDQTDGSLEIWYQKLDLEEDLPTVPLWLYGEKALPLDLSGSYAETCRAQRIEHASG
jgi:hypothetical protein